MLYLDLDGTLLDCRTRHYATYVELLSQPDLRGVPIPEAEYWGMRSENKPIKDILKKSRLFPTKFDKFCERFIDRVESPEMLMIDDVREGVVTALGKLYTKTPICLVTLRKHRENLEQQLASLGLDKYFAVVLSGAPPKLRRPDPDIRWKTKANHIRNHYRLLPTQVVYIGDTETDVKAAKFLRFEVWLLEGGHRTKALQMKADPDRIEADLSASLKYLLPGGRWQR